MRAHTRPRWLPLQVLRGACLLEREQGCSPEGLQGITEPVGLASSQAEGLRSNSCSQRGSPPRGFPFQGGQIVTAPGSSLITWVSVLSCYHSGGLVEPKAEPILQLWPDEPGVFVVRPLGASALALFLFLFTFSTDFSS